MTLVGFEASTDSPTVYEYIITLKDYEYIFITEHGNKFYALFSNDTELFLEKEVVSEIICKYGFNEMLSSIRSKGFDIFSCNECDKQGWIIRKNSTTPETFLSDFTSQNINVARSALLDSIEVKLNKNNEDFDYSSCYAKPEPDFIHYGLLFDATELMKKKEILLKGNEKSMRHTSFLYPKKVIFNGPATIVFWKDGTKTVVKCSENDKANPYNGFCAALAKKIFGNNSRVQKIVKSAEYQVPKECEDSCQIFETEGSEK